MIHPLYCLQIYEILLYLQTKRTKKAEKLQKTTNASEKNLSFPRRLAIDSMYLPLLQMSTSWQHIYGTIVISFIAAQSPRYKTPLYLPGSLFGAVMIK